MDVWIYVYKYMGIYIHMSTAIQVHYIDMLCKLVGFPPPSPCHGAEGIVGAEPRDLRAGGGKARQRAAADGLGGLRGLPDWSTWMETQPSQFGCVFPFKLNQPSVPL